MTFAQEPRWLAHDLIAPSGDRLAHLHLGVSIDVRGVEEIDSKIEGSMDQIDALFVCAHTAGVDVMDADAHASKTYSRNVRTLMTEFQILHRALQMRSRGHGGKAI